MRTTAELTHIAPSVEPIEEPWSRIDKAAVIERARTILSSTPRPFIRWAGSKQRLLSQLVDHLPTGYRAYYEPFLGAASMYFLLQPTRAHLNDYCEPLVEMYQTVASSHMAVQAALTPMDVL